VLKVNVVRDQLGNRVDNMRRRVIRAGRQQSSPRHHVRPRRALDVEEADAEVVIEVTLKPRCEASGPIVPRDRLERAIHRHNTPREGPELTPEFCIESCFTYTIDGRRKTFSQK